MVGISAASSVLSTSKTVTFDKLDTNKDGTVSMDELASVVSSSSTSSSSSAKSADKVAKLFKAMDADGDGSITSTEKDSFDAALKDRMQATGFMAQQMGGPGAPPPPPSPDDLFAAADTDGSGGVSLSEFTSGSDTSGISSDDSEALFKLIDTDSDGSITADETKSFFDSLKDTQQADGGRPNGPPPGPPPGGKPNGPPPGDDSSSSGSQTSISLLTEAAKAYGSATNNNKVDLASILASITNEAA